MRTAILGVLVAAGLVITAAVVTANPNEVYPPQALPDASAADGHLIAFSTSVGDKYQQVTLIDPKTEAMSVYQIDLADGKIRLKSVRNFHWDLQMVHLNGVTPLPREIQVLLEQQP